MVISKLVITTWDGLVCSAMVPGDTFAAKAAPTDCYKVWDYYRL